MKKPSTLKGAANVTDPLIPTETTKAEHQAIKALTQGKASEHQQGLVVEWIARATGVTDLEYRHDERAAVFAGGKRFVGLQFFQLAKSYLANDNRGT